jgi:hypothetical protein
MNQAELQRALRATDPAAVLVSARVLERVIQEVYRLPGLVWQVPHRKSCVVDRQVLFRHVEQEELELEADRLLPDTVILLRRPSAEEINGGDPGALLVKYWRMLFHASIHVELEKRQTDGKLRAEDVDARIAALGRTEFEEIRTVLIQDRYLPSQASPEAVYVEFAAVYLELLHFTPSLLPAYFPGLGDPQRVEDLLARDVNAAEVLARTRLPDAPAPIAPSAEAADEVHEYYWRLMKAAQRKAKKGNLVHAAILRTRAARVAPSALARTTRAEAQADLQALMARLQAALQLSDEEAAEWLWDLVGLLDKADQGAWPVEAAFLYDLQKVCLDNEREIYALDVMEWALSAGRRPIKRPLPGQRLVRIARHLRSACQRLTMARLSDADRQHLTRLLQKAVHHSEQGLLVLFRPVVATALEDVGLVPRNALEIAALHKIIEELLKLIAAHGFLTFGDLRDAISRNQLKIPDLGDPEEFIRGDPLLRLDRRLATLMDGIYRPSTAYMRVLERFTALNFGTKTGRWITLFVTLPFGGAYLIWEGAKLLMDKWAEWTHTAPAGVAPSTTMSVPLDYTVWLLLGLFLFALLHSPPFRRSLARAGSLAVHPLRKIFVEAPLWLVHWPALRRFLASWGVQLFYWYLFKPLLACLLIWLFLPEAFENMAGGIGIFVACSLLLNTRAGQAAQEMVRQGLLRLVGLLRAGLLPGLIRIVMLVFKKSIELVESGLFAVDEWLRFRSDAGRVTLAVRMVLGVIWFPISYLARFYMVVLVEPGFNPVKFPISCLAAKFVYPMVYPFKDDLYNSMSSLVGPVLAIVFLAPTLWLLPDAFAFLIWEMKENWKLYRANRPLALRPVAVGLHGETVRRLLQPGFHSGTIPALYARLRRGERRALQTGNHREVRAVRATLEETAGAITTFAQGELVSLVLQTASWQEQPLSVSEIRLASNRLDIALDHGNHPENKLRVEIEVQEGWLVAALPEPGWLEQLTPEQTQVLATALARFYKLAGVDLVREQLEANLPPGIAAYDLREDGLVVWRDRGLGQGAVYDLAERIGPLRARPLSGSNGSWPALDPRRLVFADVTLTWDQCVHFWEMNRAGTAQPLLLGPEVKLLPSPATN